jgi:hypothetical protein
VDHYLATRYVFYDAGTFLIGGGRPSRDVRVLGNLLYRVPMQIGYAAPYNEDCEVRDNVIVEAGLEIKNYKKAVKEGNLVVGPDATHPAGTRTALAPNRYDPDRANVAVFVWGKKSNVDLPVEGFLRPGDKYRLLSPRDFFGKPMAAGTVEGTSIAVPMAGPFAAAVLLKGGN